RVEVEIGHRVVGRVVEGAREVRPLWDRIATTFELASNLRVVRHRGERAGVGPPASPACSAAVVRSLVGVIETGGAVSHDQHERAELGSESECCDYAGYDVCHFG